MSITTGQALKYTLLPGILPRIKAFLASGFSCISFYMAYVYSMVKLLPAGHPYLNPANTGRFGIHNVIFEAKRHLVLKKENIDQIIIFYALLIGVVLLFAQFFLILANLLVPIAAAAGLGDEIGDYNNWANFFAHPDATDGLYDIAFRLLDLTFGFQDPYPIFNSCVVQGQQCQLAMTPGLDIITPVGMTYNVPTPFHLALHSLFEFYNIGILVVAFMIGGYMIVTIVGETAQSGTPFGKRFNGAWAPIRLVVAIALLTPLSFGMNGAQLLTLMMAKWGSNLASNGWAEFMFDTNNVAMPVADDGDPYASLVSRPTPPEVKALAEFMFVVQTCRMMEIYVNRRQAGGDPVVQGLAGAAGNNPAIDAYVVYGDQSWPLMSYGANGYFDANTDTEGNDVVIRFGVEDARKYEDELGHVKPICGQLTVYNIVRSENAQNSGAADMQQSYFEMIQNMWTHGNSILRANSLALHFTPTRERNPFAAPMPDHAYIDATLDEFNDYVSDMVDQAVFIQADPLLWDNSFRYFGWAGAGLWYQKVAEQNGVLYSAVYAMPTPDLYPAVMEYVKEQRRTHNDFVEGVERFKPVLSKGEEIEWKDRRDKTMAMAYYEAQQIWGPFYTNSGSNTYQDTIISIFGLDGLFDMQNNLDINPLAQLVGVGRSLVESAATNLGFSFGGGVVGGIANILGRNLVGSVALAAASFAGQIALIGLSIGFILYYIVPFLPFIYFFFAVGGWVKGIFEAMVGLPLWAMAHMRIDGEGLPGPAALNGYFLIFEIFIRPILIIFGMLASIAIFTAQVQIMNEIWQVVTSNLMGFNTTTAATAAAQVAADGTGAGVGPAVGSIDWLRGKADELFFTVIYAIIVYMMAMSSFKLIDLIPNNILRWAGQSVSTFAEQSGDPAASLVQYSYMGSQMALGPLNQGLQGIATRAVPKI